MGDGSPSCPDYSIIEWRNRLQDMPTQCQKRRRCFVCLLEDLVPSRMCDAGPDSTFAIDWVRITQRAASRF